MPGSVLRRDFISSYPLRTYKKGSVVIFQGEAPRYAYVIKSGVIKAYNLILNGDEKPVAFYKAGDFFPAGWVFSQVASATFFYEVFTKQASLYCIDRAQYVEYLSSRPKLLLETLKRQIAEELSQSMHINALQQSRASDKIIYILHFLAISTGQKPVRHKLVVGIRITHQDLANLTGLTRETIAVEINKLKKQGIISYGPGVPYSINLSKLTALVNDQYLHDLTMPKAQLEPR